MKWICDKCCKVCMIVTPEADYSEKRMNTNSMICSTSFILVKHCNRLYEDEMRINDVKSHRKCK